MNEAINKSVPRKEIRFSLDYEGATPKMDEVAKKIAESLKTVPDLVRVKRIRQIFGERKAVVDANIYDNIEVLKRYEEIKKKAKKKEAEAPAAAKAGGGGEKKK